MGFGHHHSICLARQIETFRLSLGERTGSCCDGGGGEEEHMSGIFYLEDPSDETAPPKSFSLKICHCQFTRAPTTPGYVFTYSVAAFAPITFCACARAHAVVHKRHQTRAQTVNGSERRRGESLGCTQNSSQTANDVCALCTQPRRLTTKVHQEKASMTSPFPLI